MTYALIGCGRIAVNHIKAALNNKLNIVAVCDVLPEKMEELLAKYDLQNDDSIARYTDYKKLLAEHPDLQLASIATESGIHAENVRNEVQIPDTRHVLVQVWIVRDIGDFPLAFQRLFPNGIAADVNFSRVKLQNARHGFQRRGLARAVVADEAVNLTGTDVQVQVVHSLLFPVGFCQMFNVQHIVPLLFCFVSPADPPPA